MRISRYIALSPEFALYLIHERLTAGGSA